MQGIRLVQTFGCSACRTHHASWSGREKERERGRWRDVQRDMSQAPVLILVSGIVSCDLKNVLLKSLSLSLFPFLSPPQQPINLEAKVT